MRLLNGAPFLNITCWLALLGAPAVSSATVIVPLTSTYTSQQLHKLDLNIEVLNLIWLPSLYVSCDSSFISIQFFVLKLDG